MKQKLMQNDTFLVEHNLDIPNLTFRRFRGEADYPAMVAVIQGSREADGVEWAITVEDTARDYKNLGNCDPYMDMIFAEVDGEVVGYSRCWWSKQTDGGRTYHHFAHLLPQWREKGIRSTIVQANEKRLRQIAASHTEATSKVIRCWASDTEANWESVLIRFGYQTIRYSLSMVRPNLDNIPDHPLPHGFELRPATLEQWDTIYDAAKEAFRDHWGEGEWTDADKRSWEAQPSFNPALWQVAWDGAQVAGGVLTYIDEKENVEYGRLRGYTETIFTRRAWRKRGLAHALIARSLQVQKEQGMTESALSVDAENLTGALKIYKSMGFEVVKRHASYQKLFTEQL